MSVRWLTATWQSSAMTCAYCRRAIQAGEQYRFSKTDRVYLHRSCWMAS